MSERLSLEQLKAMSDRELKRHWLDGHFPFDMATCSKCMTMHEHFPSKSCHQELRKQISSLPAKGCFHGTAFVENLKTNLEELYALRLFYDHLYPQPAPDTSESLEQMRISDLELSTGERG